MRIKIQSPIEGSQQTDVVTGVIVDSQTVAASTRPIAPPANVYHIPGHYTDGLPVKVKSHYERAYRDPQLLSIRDNIALLQARRSQLLLRIELGDSVAWRKSLYGAWDDLKSAQGRDDPDEMKAALKIFSSIMENGGDDEGIWKDIQEVDRDLVKWKEAEHKRESDMKVTLSLAEATARILGYHEAVLDVVTDPGQRAAINARVAAMFRDSATGADRAIG